MTDIFKINNIHLVGIKGVAMAAMAVILKQLGKTVTGSDTTEEFPTQKILDDLKLTIYSGFDVVHIQSGKTDMVIYTGAHNGKNNSEVRQALKLKIPVMSHGQALGELMQQKTGISVAGSHGKTTTSAMIAHVLVKVGKDPAYSVGCGEILSLETPAAWGKGEYFVAEADEYVTDPTSDATPRFMWQQPKYLVITNIDFDHPDVYKDLDSVKEAFLNFINQNKRLDFLIVNADDETSKFLSSSVKVPLITFGKDPAANFRISDIRVKGILTGFNLSDVGKIKLAVPGEHNVSNAAAAAVLLKQLGLTNAQITDHLATFTGTKRRLEKFGELEGTLFIDDYAHHPKEIAASIAALKNQYHLQKLIVIFQPHTFSRTQSLFYEFSRCFSGADKVVITDIYASAREKPIPDITAKALVNEVKKHHPDTNYQPDKQAVLKYLGSLDLTGTVVVLMGAGDIYNWQADVLKIKDGQSA